MGSPAGLSARMTPSSFLAVEEVEERASPREMTSAENQVQPGRKDL